MTCDICEHWTHLECSKLSRYEYDFFGNNPLPDTTPLKLKFICSTCQQAQDPSTDLMARLIAQVDNISKQNILLQEGLAAVLDLVSGKSEESKEDVVKSVKKTVVESVEETMQTSIKEALDDSKEKEEKKNNVIIFNLEEPKKEVGKQESDYHKEDLTKLNQLLRAAQGDLATPLTDKNQVTRLGHKKDDSVRPRPMKVSFDTTDEKWHLVCNSRNIKKVPCYKDVQVQDKTRK